MSLAPVVLYQATYVNERFFYFTKLSRRENQLIGKDAEMSCLIILIEVCKEKLCGYNSLFDY